MPEEEVKAPTKRRKVGYALAQAILSIHERKKLSHYCNYAAVAARYDLSEATLKSAYSKWLHGHIDLGIVDMSPEEKAIDLRATHSKTLELVNRHLNLLLVHYERSIFDEENATKKDGKGGRTPTDKIGRHSPITFLSRELMKVLGLRAITEKGFDSFLAAIEEGRRKPGEKQAKVPNPDHPAPIDVQTHVITATDEQRMIEALRGDG
jgi:hypothetical protein